MKYYIYILQSLKDGRYYIGFTTNIQQRLEYHNSGKQRSTRNRIPLNWYTERSLHRKRKH